MTDGVLGVRGHLGRGLPEAIGLKDRVVAEPSAAPGHPDQPALDLAGYHPLARYPVGRDNQRRGAHESRAEAGVRHVGDLGQYQIEIRSVVAVLGISPDQPAKLAKFRDSQGLTFPLLSDPDHAVLEAYGAYGEKKLYGKTTVGVIRSTFVVDADGNIEKAMYGVKATGHVARLRAEVGA